MTRTRKHYCHKPVRPSHASNTLIEIGLLFPIGWRNRRPNFQVIPKFCISLYISTEASDICQGGHVMKSAMMSTVLNMNGSLCHILNDEVPAVVYSE